MKKIIKNLVLCMICLIGIGSVSYSVCATDIAENQEQEIMECIQGFFKNYEEENGPCNITYEMGTLKKYVTGLNKNDIICVTSRGKLISERKSFINTIKYMLERKSFILTYSEVDLKEYNKEVVVTPISIDITGDVANVEVEVYKKWNYSFSPDIQSECKDNYKVTLRNEGDVYRISDIVGFGDSIFDEFISNANDKISFSMEKRLLDDVKNIITNQMYEDDEYNIETYSSRAKATYNATKATKYALNHALSYNKDYADFNGYGGDCTNFISQCLYAGGITQHTGTAYSSNSWYYKSSTDRSATWTGADKFRNYVFGKSSKIDMEKSSWKNVINGDIIQLLDSDSSAYHSMIITGVANGSSGRSDLLICCHTKDRRHASLAMYFGGTTKSYYHVKGTK